jgi:hypothetical protein
MSDRIVVTPAQVTAAKIQVALADELGETVSALVRRIAEAKVRPKVGTDGAAPAESPART